MTERAEYLSPIAAVAAQSAIIYGQSSRVRMLESIHPLRALALFALGLVPSLAGGTSLQERFLAYGDPPPLSEEQLLTKPEPLRDIEPPRYKDPMLLFKSPLLVYVSFIVNEDGTVGEVKVAVPSGRPSYDVHVVTHLLRPEPRFRPGTVRGKPAAMPYFYEFKYVPNGKEDAFLKKLDAVLDAALALEQRIELQLEELRAQARQEEEAERTARRERYRREAPYRYLPRTPLTDVEMAKRLLQLELLFTHCGSGLFRKLHGDLYQYAGGRIEVTQQNLTSLDRLNGYEWKGSVTFRYSLVRATYPRSREWDDWIQPRGNGGRLGIDLQKKKGKWVWDWNGQPQGEPVTCAEILPTLRH